MKFPSLAFECNHIETIFFMKFSARRNLKINESDIKAIDQVIEGFALITKAFTFKTDFKGNLKNMILKKFKREGNIS